MKPAYVRHETRTMMTVMMTMMVMMMMMMIWFDTPLRWWRHSWCTCSNAKGNEKRFYKIDIVNFWLHFSSPNDDDDDDDYDEDDDDDDDLAVTRTLQNTRRVVVHL